MLGRLSVAVEKDLQVKRVLTPDQDDLSNSEEGGYLTDEAVEDIQHKVLSELQKINTRLDAVEEKVASLRSQGGRTQTDKLSTSKV